ncbi:MAG: transglycosylase SLT domain-containing protein [Longimicrobiales bacterium]
MPEGPISVPPPTVNITHTDVPTSAPSPALPPPPAGVPDAIMDSRWARDPDVAARSAEWVRYWSNEGRSDFQIYLERMERYRLVVDPEIEARGMPPSLRVLPMIESGYRPAAVSPAGAAGLWQFMSGTARSMGLTVTSLVDERLDPVRSTPLALDFLVALKERFGSWYVALAAYNAGPARVAGILRRHAPLAPSGDSLYVELRRELPPETSDLIPKLLAASRIVADPGRYGLKPPGTVPLLYDEVTVPDATSLDVLADVAGVQQREIEELNPQLLRGFTPYGARTTVRVPEGAGRDFGSRYSLVPKSQRISFLEHRVGRGETFSHIALRYGVRVAALQAANPGIRPRRLQIGQWLVVPRVPRAGEQRRSGRQ